MNRKGFLLLLFFYKSSPCVILGRVDSEINVLCKANLKTENNTLSLDMTNSTWRLKDFGEKLLLFSFHRDTM